MKFICQLLILACFSTFAFNATAQEFRKIEGKILTADTKVPVPYAAIGLSGSGIGTICDEAGNFELKIPDSYKGKEICVSALGYKQICQPASGFMGANHTVSLEPANLQLQTVEIKALSAESLVKEAIRRIPENYADKPVLYTYYHRQLHITNDKPDYIIESVNEGFKNHPKKDFQSSIRKSRGMATSKKNTEKMNGTWVQVNSIAMYTDIAWKRPFLQASKYKNYIYQLEKEDQIGKDTVYVVSFKPKLKKNGQAIVGSEGKLFLHCRSKAIIRVESTKNQAALDKENNSFLIQAANKIEKGILEFQKDIDVFEYKQHGNRWYLSHVYSDWSSQFTLNASPAPERHHNFSQLVVSKLQLENVTEIPEELRAKKFANFYSTAPKDMNEGFWQQYNIMPLPEAYKNAQL